MGLKINVKKTEAPRINTGIDRKFEIGREVDDTEETYIRGKCCNETVGTDEDVIDEDVFYLFRSAEPRK